MAKKSAPQGGSRARRVFLVIFMLVIIAGLALGLSNGADAINSWFRDKEVEKQPADPVLTESERIRSETVLVIGSGSNDQATGFSYVRFDAANNAIYQLTIRPDIVIPLPDGKAQILKDIYAKDPTLAMSHLSGYLGIPAAHWVLTPRSQYGTALQDQNPAAFFGNVDKTNFSKKEFLTYKANLEAVPAENHQVQALASSPLECGSALYNEPHRETNAEYIAACWGVDPATLTAATQVTIYNGTETKGLASSVAETLLFNGFQIPELGNAKTFDYDVTEIESHEGVDRTADIEKLSKLMGVQKSAIVKPTLKESDEYDLAVFIGKDCTIEVKD